jgi:hypothetical protein
VQFGHCWWRLGGGAVEKKQVYFEYAKVQWESDQVSLLACGCQTKSTAAAKASARFVSGVGAVGKKQVYLSIPRCSGRATR